MKRKIWPLLILLAVNTISNPQAVKASSNAASSAVLQKEANKPDKRAEILKGFLEDYESPLSFYAPLLVETADKYQLDWKLIPAITGVESTFGKRIPSNSYNAYGWNNGNYHFASWEQSIKQVALTLKEKYINRGLDNPSKIAPIYAPPSKTWARKVIYFMKQLENFQLRSPDLTL